VLSLDRVIAERARDRARATGLPHNPARAVFRESLLAALTEQAVRLIDADSPPDVLDDIAVDVRLELSGNRAFHAAVESWWPLLTAQRFLADFYRSLPAEHVLFRADGDAWTVSDVPQLDEAVELLGSSERVEEPSADVEYARECCRSWTPTPNSPARSIPHGVSRSRCAAPVSARGCARWHRRTSPTPWPARAEP
jgi:hypothetical protein